MSGESLDRLTVAARTGLSSATVFRTVDDLLTDGLVAEREVLARRGPGRPTTTIGMNAAAALVAGVDLGGTNCRIVVADALGRPVGRTRDATPRGLDADGIAAWLADAIRWLAERSAPGVPLRSVVVGVPGVVAGDKQRIVGAVNLSQLVGNHFIAALAGHLGIASTIDNDSNLALRGELQYGDLSENQTTVLLSLGTGLGAAIALDGRILSGSEGLLGEFGRLLLPGRPQRLRDLLSGAGLLSLARSRGLVIESAAALFADPEGYADLLAEVRAALVHLTNVVALAYEPATVVLTGGFANSLSTGLLAGIRDDVAEQTGVRLRMQHARLGESAGLLGAMAVALSGLYSAFGVTDEHQGDITVDSDTVIAGLSAIDPIQPANRLERKTTP